MISNPVLAPEHVHIAETQVSPLATGHSGAHPYRLGIGGPVGTGKTALVVALCRALWPQIDLAVVTNDIYTTEDARFVQEAGVLPAERVVGVETGGCPHTAIRDDVSLNLAAIEQLQLAHPGLRLVLVESGGDNLAASFSPDLVESSIYVIDVAGGDKVPRKGGPGISRSDLLVINKIDLAAAVGASLAVMERDSAAARAGRPVLFTDLRGGVGVDAVVTWVLHQIDWRVERVPPAPPAQPNILIHCIRTSAGKTAAAVQHSRAPLHASTLYRASPLLGPDALSIALVHAGSALLPGDALAVDLRLDPGAHLHVTTVGATCIHGPSPRVPQAPPSLLRTRYSVAADAALVVLPHAVIPFARATLQTTTELCLEDGAVCAIGEIMAAGRIARGEVFAFREMCSTLTLSIGGRLLAMDRLRLQPPHASFDMVAMHPHAALSWGAYTHLATLWLSAPWAGDALAARLHAEIQHLAPGAGPAVGSATHAQGPVVLVRLLGHNAQSLKVILEQLSAIALREGRAQPCTG